MSGNAIGVVGADGKTPIYQPDSRWNVWSIHEIYTGELGENKYIPKIDDYIIEPETGVMYRVVSLNAVTYIPILTVANIRQDITNINPISGNPGIIIQNPSDDRVISISTDGFRVYYDKSISPYTLTPDGFLHTYSTTATFARIYKGNFIDPTKIISRRYDNNGNFIGHDIPLTAVAYNSHDNYAVKNVPGCNCDVELQNGEDCIIVLFDSQSKVVNKIRCIIEETTYVTQAYAEQKYITQIFMKSVFIDGMQTTDVNYPVNLPIASFNPIGVVQYNDGSQVEYPIDGNKFKLYGLDQFVSTIIGHRVPLVLSYRLDSTESALASVNSDSFYVTRSYNLVVSNPNRSYNVKLFVYPVWINSVSGYTYKVFLMNLDRNILYDVTNITGLASNSPAFNPIAYGITQRLTFSINLANIGGIYNQFLHVQTVDIILRAQANDHSATNIWEVGNQIPTSIPYFGTNLRAVRNGTNFNKVTIGNNLSLNDFVIKLYRATLPLFNPTTELEAPNPTHIEVRYLDEGSMAPISEYNNTFSFNKDINMYGNIDIVFYKETVTGFLKLSVCSLCVR